MEQRRKKTDIRTLLWLWGLLAIGCLLVFHSYILGNETMVFADVGSDTKEQYIMQYSSIVNHLRNKDFSTWDFHNGFGADLFILNPLHPFLMLIYLLGVIFGPEHLTKFMVFLQILQIFLAGTACYYFLSEFDFKEKYKLPACFMYAFNGYLMIWGQHYQLGSILVWLPLLLMFVEKSLKNRKWALGAALISGIMMVNGFYQGYMCMLGGGVYVTLRVLLGQDASRKKKWKDFAANAFSMGLGVGLGAINLFPSAAAMIGATSRLNSNETLPEKVIANLMPWERDYYKTLIYRLFGSNMQNSGTYFSGYKNYYEAANWFFSTLFILLLAQYIFTIHRQEKKRSQKAAQYLGVLFGAFMVLIPTGSLIFNGFAYSFARHTFLLMPMFALISAAVLQQILEEKKISYVGFAGAVAAIVIVYAKAYRFMDDINNKSNAFALCLTGLIMAGLLLVGAKSRKADRKLCYLLLMAALFANVISDTTIDYRYRDTLKKNDADYYEGTFASSVDEALAWIASQDDSFYRVEKDFRTASGCMDAMVQGYDGVSTYNSTQNSNIAAFVKKLWPQLLTGYDTSHYKFANTVRESSMAALTGVKYLLSRGDDLAVEGYQLLHQVGEIYIYRNTSTESIGKFFDKTVTEEDYEAYKKAYKWDLLKEVLIVEEETAWDIGEKGLDEYKRKKEELQEGEPVLQKREDGTVEQITIPLQREKLQQHDSARIDFTLEMTGASEMYIRMNDDREVTYFQYPGKKSYSYFIPQGTEQITIRFSNPGAEPELTKLNFYVSDRESAFSEDAEISISAPVKDSCLEGNIRAEKDGMVMLAIPYENGWSVFLNGEEQTLVTGDYGFIAFEVKAGEYELAVSYTAPLFREGVIVTLVSLAVFVVLCLYSCRGSLRSKKQR